MIGLRKSPEGSGEREEGKGARSGLKAPAGAAKPTLAVKALNAGKAGLRPPSKASVATSAAIPKPAAAPSKLRPSTSTAEIRPPPSSLPTGEEGSLLIRPANPN